MDPVIEYQSYGPESWTQEWDLDYYTEEERIWLEGYR